MRLLRPGSIVGRIGDALVPADLYPLAYEPVAVFGMAYPTRIDWAALADRGVGHVVCLTHDAAPYDPAPLRCTAIRLADLYHGGVPLDAAAERARVERAARVVVELIREGVGVAAHCHAGRGRTGVVLGAALVMLGHDPVRVVEHLDRVQRERGKHGWPESPWQAEVVAAAADWRLSSRPRA